MARDGFACDRRQVDRLVAHRELAAVHAGEVEEVADESLEPAALDADHPRRLVGAERAVGESLGVAADRRQRRLQLVADREQEVALGLARGRELLRHLVERLRERRNLPGAFLRQRRLMLVGGECARGVGDTADRAGDRAGDQERERRRERRARERREQEVAQERLPLRRAQALGAQQEQAA